MAELDTLCSEASLIALSNLIGLLCNGCFFDNLGLQKFFFQIILGD